MDAIMTVVQSGTASSSQRSSDVEHVSQHTFDGLRTALETEVSGMIDRLITGAVTEADAAVAHACAASKNALTAVQTALQEQTRRHDGLTKSLVQSEMQIEELQLKLKVERESTEAVRASYEARLHSVQRELDTVRVEFLSLEQQFDIEASERALLTSALKTVQQACAFVEPQSAIHAARLTKPTYDDRAPENAGADAAVQMHDDETAALTIPATGRSLKLVAPSEVTRVAAPPQLATCLKDLFEQIHAMYWVDVKAHAAVDVVERLSANVRHARRVFVQRASSEGMIGGKLFEQELSAQLDEFGATSLGRHLAIAAYELTQVGEDCAHAEAS